MSDTHTTHDADSTKPVACRACGGEPAVKLNSTHWQRDDDGRNHLIETHQVSCLCGASARTAETRPLAVAAWNRMWAPRAGEATKVVVKIAAGLLQSSRSPEASPHGAISTVVRLFGESSIDAALAELGLAAGREEARG